MDTELNNRIKISGRDVIEFIAYLAGAVVLAFLIVKFIAVRSVVDGGSMNPMFSDNDNLIVQKISYYFHEPERFDVIVFELRDDPGTHYIKRVIGLPGERVRVADGIVYINDEPLTEDIYGKEPMNKSYRASEDILLGEDEYFVLGDNRNHSKDSRTWEVGNIQRKQFVGKVWCRFWPFKTACFF